MFIHTIKLILRRFKRQWLFTSIHAVGLSVGFASCLLIFLFIRYETNFDKYHHNGDRTYRVNVIGQSQGDIEYSSSTPFPFGVALRNDFPEFESVARNYYSGTAVLKAEEKDLQEVENIFFSDPELFDIFDIPMVKGAGKKALQEPNKILLSESQANRLFGKGDPLGQTLRYDNKVNLEVAGVFKDQPATTHLQSDAFISLSSLTEEISGFDVDNWGFSIGSVTYLLLKEGQEAADFKKPLAEFTKKYMDDPDDGTSNELVLQPLSDLHFNTQYNENSPVLPISPTILWVFASIGILILLMACFNFINLSLAANVQKRLEVSMRKILGAQPLQLWQQYWGEAFFLASCAMIFGLITAFALVPSMNDILNKQIDPSDLYTWPAALFMLTVVVFVSLIAGGYPAWVLARQDAMNALKSAKSIGNRGDHRLRQAMVVAQFIITILIINGAITVARQMTYIHGKDLGFNNDGIIQVSTSKPGNKDALKEEWLRNPAVKQISFSLGAPISDNNINTTAYPLGGDEVNETKRIVLKAADPDYLDTYGIELLAGRRLTWADTEKDLQNYPEEGKEYPILINEALAKQFGYSNPVDMLGKRIVPSINNMHGHIVGIVKDFNNQSLHQAVEPIIIKTLPFFYYQIGLKVDMNQMETLLPSLEKTWKKHYPDDAFNYTFFDQYMTTLYADESRMLSLMKIFAGLAILIACLGLFGLAAIFTTQRKSEIGLRKVLGASLKDIVVLLSKDMAFLIILAAIISLPLAWKTSSLWLENFAYRTDFSWSAYGLASIILLLLALFSIGGQTIKAALANPVDVMRNE